MLSEAEEDALPKSEEDVPPRSAQSELDEAMLTVLASPSCLGHVSGPIMLRDP